MTDQHISKTDKLINNYYECKKANVLMTFYVGRWTGYGTGVIASLRRRGWGVQRTAAGSFYLIEPQNQAA